MPGEHAAFGLAHRWWAAGLYAAGAQVVHEVAHVEQRADVGGGIPFAAMAEHVAAFLDDLGGERQVAGDDEVAGAHAFDDLVVGHVEAGGNLHAADIR